MKRVSNWYEWMLFLPALLPLFYVEGMMYPLMAPKTLALRALGIIALALFTYLSFAGWSFYWSRLRRWETWVPGALLAVAYLSSLLGTGFYHSFWSTFERGDGLLTLSVCIGYFYFVLLSADATWLKRLFRIVGWVGSLAAVYLVLQWLVSLEVISLPFIVKPNGRIGGTMGNAAFLASYLGMAFFMTVAAAREYVGRARALLYAGAALELFAILLAATRGTLLALFLVGVLWLLYYAGKGSGKMRAYSGAALFSLVIVTGLFVAFRADLARAPIESVRRLASISLADSTVASRLFIWRTISGEAIKKPVLGHGAEHITIMFDRVYDPTAIAEEWFDRTHNAYLDYFVQFGIVGVLLYLALIAILAGIGLRLWIRGDRAAPFILSLAAVYAVQNFFVFDTAVTLWLLLALLSAGYAYAAADKSLSVAFEKPRMFAGALLGFAILLLIIPVALQPLQANLLAFEAYLYQIADVPRANAATERGMALRTYADLEFGYNAYFMYTDEQVNRLVGEELRLAYENASKVLTTDFNRYPYDARTAVYLAQVLASAPAGAPLDKPLLSDVLAHAIKGSPKRAQPWYILANLSISEANIHPVGSDARMAGYAAAKDILRRYIMLVPALAEPRFVLAQLEYASGDSSAASLEAAKGKAHYKSDLGTARRAASYYESVLDLPNAAFFLREILQFDPGNTNAQEDLSKIETYEGSLR
ncbi:O-antigen ligase family protein [Candidatus Kaiserbacteria bacterium]|nr:O-antigen ligase family protein [Candidatus Kaiserbacteria bacterium]